LEGYNACVQSFQNVSISGDLEALTDILCKINRVEHMSVEFEKEMVRDDCRYLATKIITSMRSWVVIGIEK